MGRGMWSSGDGERRGKVVVAEMSTVSTSTCISSYTEWRISSDYKVY